MTTYRTIAIGTALALALGLSLDAVRGDSTGSPDGVFGVIGEAAAATFHQPKLDGMNLDIRLMAHMRADPTQTAQRFCRDKGYPMVADLVIRPSSATRTLADGAAHADRAETKQAFALIVCRSHDARAIATS